MASATHDRDRYRDALAVDEFRAMLGSHLISMLGTVVAELALTVLVYDRSGSPLLASLVFALGFLPYLLAGTLLSALVDRLPSRRLVVTCNLLSAAVAALMAAPSVPVPALLGLAFALGLIAPVFAGTRAATLADVLSGSAYAAGRSLLRIVSQGVQVGGFALGGALLAVASPRGALLLNAGCFVASATVLRFGTRERPPSAAAVPSLVRDSLAGIGLVLGHRPLGRLLTLGWVVPMLGAAPEALVVPYAHSLGAESVQAGLLLGALPTGFVLGELAIWRLNAATQIRLMPVLSAVTFAPLLLYAAHPGLAATFAILLTSGTGGAQHLGLDRLVLAAAPEALRSKALSLQAAGLMFWQGVGFAAAGAAAEVLPLPQVVVIAALTGLLAVGVCTRGLGGR